MTLFGLHRHFRDRIYSTWPTKIWGATYTANGTMQYRFDPSWSDKKRAFVRATARMTLEKNASQITKKYLPRQIEEANSELALRFSNWCRLDVNSPIEIRAAITLRLENESVTRAQEYEDALRERQLAHEINDFHVSHLRDKMLGDADTARAWWIERHREGCQPIAWDEFNKHILPFVGRADDPQTNAMRTAYILSEVVNRLEGDPERHELFIGTIRLLMKEMGWPDLAEIL